MTHEGQMPTDLSRVTATVVGNTVRFSPSGYTCPWEVYDATFQLVSLWNPLETVGSSGKMIGLVERYLRTGDPHEEPVDPFEQPGEGFIDEW